MNWSQLFQPAFRDPMLWSGGAALLLFLLVWWRERDARSVLPQAPLAVLGLVWVLCHLIVNKVSYVMPPGEAVDWLVPGAGAMVLLGLVSWWQRKRNIPVAWLSALFLAVAAWLALRQLPWLFDREESPAQRLLWRATGVAGVLAAFASAEWAARRVSAAAMLAGLAMLALGSGLGFWRMAFQERMVARPLAVAAMAAGAALAACLRRQTAVLTPGMAGWTAGGILVLFFCACVTRAPSAPVWPMAAALAAIPATILLVAIHRRRCLSGAGTAWLAGMAVAGTVIYLLCAANRQRQTVNPVSPASTGADDTGAYD